MSLYSNAWVRVNKLPMFIVTLDGVEYRARAYRINPCSSAVAGNGGDGFVSGGNGGNAVSISSILQYRAKVWYWSEAAYRLMVYKNEKHQWGGSPFEYMMTDLNLVVEMNCTTYKVVKAQ